MPVLVTLPATATPSAAREAFLRCWYGATWTFEGTIVGEGSDLQLADVVPVPLATPRCPILASPYDEVVTVDAQRAIRSARRGVRGCVVASGRTWVAMTAVIELGNGKSALIGVEQPPDLSAAALTCIREEIARLVVPSQQGIVRLRLQYPLDVDASVGGVDTAIETGVRR
jgi:hypothetical protein